MKQKHLVSLLQSGFTTIQVQFPNNDTPQAPTVQLPPVPWGSAEARQQPMRAPPAPIQARAYTYKARGAIAVGDQVVVDTDRAGLVVANVVGVDPVPRIDMDADFEYKWIVQKIDRVQYDKDNAAELAFADTLQAVEREKHREEMVASFQERLPSGSAARALFDKAMVEMNGGQPPAPSFVASLEAAQTPGFEDNTNTSDGVRGGRDGGMQCK